MRRDSPLSMRVLGKYNAMKMAKSQDDNPYTEHSSQTIQQPVACVSIDLTRIDRTD